MKLAHGRGGLRAGVAGVLAGATSACRTPRSGSPAVAKDCAVSAADYCGSPAGLASARNRPCSADVAGRVAARQLWTPRPSAT